jgi:hypothetical protein
LAIKSDPASAAAKFQRRILQAGQDYTTGVQKSAGWAQPAMAAKARRDAGLQAAIANDSINKGIQNAGDSKWRANTLAKGAPAWVQAAPRAAQNYQAAVTKVFGYLANAQSATAGMDTSSVQARIAKAGAFQLSMHQQAQQAKGLSA